MKRLFAGPVGLLSVLYFVSAVTLVMTALRLVQIPMGLLPEMSRRFEAVPLAHFSHAAAGLAFGLIGPVQFARVLRNRFGRLHRVLGRIYGVAGLVLALSALRLLWEFPGTSTPLLDAARIAAGAGLVIALWLGIAAARSRETARHRAWMIRAYAIGLGQAPIVFTLGPAILITGEPVNGLVSDLIHVGTWAICLGIGEWVIRRGEVRRAVRGQAPA